MTLNVHFGIKFASQSSLIFLPKVQLTPHFDLMQKTVDLVTFTEEILNGKLHKLIQPSLLDTRHKLKDFQNNS